MRITLTPLNITALFFESDHDGSEGYFTSVAFSGTASISCVSFCLTASSSCSKSATRADSSCARGVLGANSRWLISLTCQREATHIGVAIIALDSLNVLESLSLGSLSAYRKEAGAIYRTHTHTDTYPPRESVMALAVALQVEIKPECVAEFVDIMKNDCIGSRAEPGTYPARLHAL